MKKVIILHGWTYSLEKWQAFLDILKKRNIKPIMLNVPGLTSEKDKVWNMEDYVNWLNENLKKEKEKVILLGHSNGGRIALNFAIEYSQKIEKLILIDSAGIYHNELPIALKRVIFRTLAKFGKKLTSSNMLKNILYKIVGGDDYKNASSNMKITMLNLLNSDKFLKPEKIQMQTLIIWGREDRITPASDGRSLHQKIKDSKIFIVEGARHSPQFTHPTQVADVIVSNLTI